MYKSRTVRVVQHPRRLCLYAFFVTKSNRFVEEAVIPADMPTCERQHVGMFWLPRSILLWTSVVYMEV